MLTPHKHSKPAAQVMEATRGLPPRLNHNSMNGADAANPGTGLLMPGCSAYKNSAHVPGMPLTVPPHEAAPEAAGALYHPVQCCTLCTCNLEAPGPIPSHLVSPAPSRSIKAARLLERSMRLARRSGYA